MKIRKLVEHLQKRKDSLDEAAPDLLEACNKAKTAFNHIVNRNDKIYYDVKEAWEAVSTAIKKAKGA